LTSRPFNVFCAKFANTQVKFDYVVLMAAARSSCSLFIAAGEELHWRTRPLHWLCPIDLNVIF